MRASMGWTVACGLTWASAVSAGEKVPLEKAPAAAVKAVKERFPKAEITGVELEKEKVDGKAVYEFSLKEGERSLDLEITEDGKFVKVEELIKEGDAPAVVREALAKKYPGYKVVKAEKMTSGEGDAAKVEYEFLIKTDKDKREVVFDAAGKFLEEELNKADDDD